MTSALPGLAPPVSLALVRSLVGFDPSTLRMSAAGLIPRETTPEPWVDWSTLSLPKVNSARLHVRQSKAIDTILPWLRELDADWGEPKAVAIEQPFSFGHHTEPSSYYVVGALLVAVGRVWPLAELFMVVPGWWKSRATGAGSVSGVRGEAEKKRILEWARECAGYSGELFDEADAIGVVTAVGVELERRRSA